MRIFFLFFLSSSLGLVSLPLTAQPKKEGIKLLVRLIREGDNEALRKQMLGVTTSRLWTDKLEESFRRKVSHFLDETFDSLMIHLPHEEADWRSYIAKRLNLSFSDSEYQEIVSLIRMTKGEREALFRSVVSPMITSWRSHLRAHTTAMTNGVSEWRNIKENFLTDRFPDDTGYIEWVHELDGTSLGFKMVRCPNGIQYTLFLEPGPHLSLDRLPTHLKIGQTSQVFDIVYFQSKYGFMGTVDSFSLLPTKHRFATLSFIRKETASPVNRKFVSEKFSDDMVDLTTGRVYSGWYHRHSHFDWLAMVEEPMIALFRQELVRFRSPLSKLLLTTLENLKMEGGYNIDNFVERELTLIENGIFRYRLARFNFGAGSFESHSPVLAFVIDMNDLSRPRVLSFDISP